MVRLHRKQSGFTLIELLVAMTMMSFVILIALVVFIQINGMYYKGLSTTKAQEAARAISEDIVKEIQATGGATQFPTITTTTGESRKVLCTNSAVYLMRENQLAANDNTGNRHIFAKFRIAGSVSCPQNDAAFTALLNSSSDSYDFLSGNFSVHGFNFASNELYLTIAYANIVNNPTILESVQDFSRGVAIQTKRCAGGFTAGNQYCATASLRTAVYARTN